MFYSQFILAKKGPLGTIWIAAHLERKLKKNQVADTDIGVSVDSILFPEVPIALRLSSHLLLGVVKIYSRKVNYLFNDCSETLVKIRQAFQSTTVDLPPEESTAPYHSITLPETFDFDDLELPESSFSYSNFVDHHVTTREQITLQDPVEDTVYLGSQFGLDERFGDGDGAQVGLDFDEDLFGDELFSPGPSSVATHADEKASAMTIETPTKKNKTGIDSKILMGDDPLENDEAGISYDREPSLGGPNQIPKSSVQSDPLQLAEAPELTYNDEDKSSLQTVVQTSITEDSVAMSSAQISANSSLISLPAGIEKTKKELFSESGNLLFSESLPVSGNVEKQPLPSENAERLLLSNSNSQSTEMTQPKFENSFSYPLSFPANAQPSLTKAYEQVSEETSTKNQVDQSLEKKNDEEALKTKNVMESESFQGTSLSVLPESISELDSTMTHGLQMSPFNESPLLAPIETFQQHNMQMRSGDIAKDFSKSEDVNDLTSAIPSTLMSYQEVNQAPNPETHSVVREHDYSKDMGNYESTLTTGAQQPSSLTVIQLNDVTKLQPQVPELTGASLQQTECVQNIGLLADVHKGNYSRNDDHYHEGAKSFDGAVSLQQTECVQNIGLMADVHKGNYSRNDDQYHEGAKAFDEAFSKLSGQQVQPGAYHYSNHLESVERDLQDFNKVNINHTLLDEALNNKASMSFPHAQTTMVENQTHFVPLAYSNAGTREFQQSIVSNIGTETTQQMNQTTNSSQPLFTATNSQEFSKPMEINLSTFNPSTVYSSEATFQQLGQIVEPQNLLHSDINDTNYFQRNLIGQRVENISTEENFFPDQLNLVSSSGQETATGLHHPEGSSMPLQAAAADGLNFFSPSGDILNIFPSTAGMHGVFSNMQNGSLLRPCSSFEEAGKHGFNSDLSYSPSSVYLKESESAAFTKNSFTTDLATITQAAQMHSSHSSDELSNALLASELNNRVLGSYQAVSNQFQQENAKLSTAIAACETLRSSVDAVNQTVIDSTDSYEKIQTETYLGDGRSPVSTLQNNSSRKRLVRESVPIFKESSSGKRRSSHSSKRTNHVAGEDDILASILGRTPSFIVKENPVETVSAKRQKTTHKTTSPKRKAVIDVAMVLQPDVIRQQLSNTEDIRRVRKKAPCTPREVWMLHWESKGPQTLYESSIAGQCPALNELYHNVCVLKGEMPQSSKTIENSLDNCQNLDSVIKEQRPEIGFSQLNSTEQSTEIVPNSAGMPLRIEHELDYTGMQIDSIEKEQGKQAILDRSDPKCNAKHIDTVYRNHSQMQPLNAVSELSDSTASLDTRKRKPTNQRVEVLDSESHGEGILCYKGKNQDETSSESLKATRDETDREDMSLESDRRVIVSEKATMKGNMLAGSASHDQSVDKGHQSEPVTNPLASVGDISNGSQLQENVSELNSQRPPSIEGNNMVDKDHEKNKSPLITSQTESRDLLDCRVEVSYNENESNMNFSSDNIKENLSSDFQNKEISFKDQNKTAMSHDDVNSHLPSEIFDDHKEKSSNLIPQDTPAVFPVSHLQPSPAVEENTDNMKNIDMSNSNANVTPDTYQDEHALQQFGEKNQYSNNVGEGLKAANVEKKETDISESFNVLSNLVDERDLLQSSEFVNDANDQNQQFSMDVDLLSQEKPKTEPFQNNSDAINIAFGPNKEETQVLYNVKENEEYFPEFMTEVNIETHEALQTVPIEHESLEQRQNNEKLGDLSTANQPTTENDKTSDIKETEFVNDGLTQHSLIEQSTKQNARATAFADNNVRNHDYTTEGAVRPADFLIVEDIDDDQFVFEGNNTENAGKGQIQDNSGWSARTRAVSKYLKNTFEAMDHHSRHIYEHNKKKLGLDGLLVDKTRKEAARMFFETLVLKTRDYVHVEQENPFGDVSILPRGKLMKTNF